MTTTETKSHLLSDTRTIEVGEPCIIGSHAQALMMDTQIQNEITMSTITTCTDYEAIDIEPNNFEFSYNMNDEPTAESAPPPVMDIEIEPLPLSRTRSLSDKLNRSAPILFLKNHGKKMAGKESDSCSRGDYTWTNWMVGVSCAFFLLPSLLIVALRAWKTVRPCIIFDCVYFLIVSICSFLSDYVYSWPEEKPCIDFTWLDQWTATGGVVVVFIGIIVNPYPLCLRIVQLMTLLGAIYCIGKSRKAMNKFEWRKWHSIWHLYCGIGLSLFYVQEYMLKTGYISSDLWWPIW